ncbi:MAG: [FeFe] hydrogenase H-cluster radical SAM maturase HydG [Coxiella sp. DG_40]|nr:MAG: [FeFe] hydrogenase H-cluster radical SAM maturase HydG [Coxiella sp. DG_40]
MINAAKIISILNNNSKEDYVFIREILAKASEAKGLNLEEVAALTTITNPELIEELFTTAKHIKQQIYGKRLVLFAPLYISNLCTNECLYCAFRATNKAIKRRSLTQQEIANEVKHLINEGHKRLLLVAGEAYTRDGFQYILDSIKTIYNTKNNHGEIRRVNVNIAPLTLKDFQKLKAAQIGTYQLFQETYHRDTYQKVHIGGKKADYEWRLTAIERAMQAGIDDVGIGVLFGLDDWRFEILALLQHSQYLDKKYGVGPHTISVPRIEPATGSPFSQNPPFPVSDSEFRKIIAILRLAIPYTGIILSTRETPETRREVLALGISQISAGSRTNPGGYSVDDTEDGQFSLGDHRHIGEVIQDIAKTGYIPSFCTACYRLGRTGEHFMDLAKVGKIKSRCAPNGLATFQEYLEDYASPETYQTGTELINKELSQMPQQQAKTVTKMIEKIKNGNRDVYI